LASVPNQNDFNNKKLYSLPRYYGYVTAMWSIIPAIFLVTVISSIKPEAIGRSVLGYNQYILPLVLMSLVFITGAFYILKPSFNAREHFEGWIKKIFILCCVISV